MVIGVIVVERVGAATRECEGERIIVFVVLKKIWQWLVGGFEIFDGDGNGEAAFFVGADAFKRFTLGISKQLDENGEEISVFV